MYLYIYGITIKIYIKIFAVFVSLQILTHDLKRGTQS